MLRPLLHSTRHGKMMQEPDVILLDIEGTTSPISFVYDTLFPYARLHLRAFLAENWNRPDVIEDIGLLAEEAGSSSTLDQESSAETLLSFMDEDRKSTSLKSIQGKIWAAGFNGGALKGSFFPDVAPALKKWKNNGTRVAIYSSGSIQAQQLLFSSSDEGDLRGYISAWFDTRTGSKVESASYSRIASEMGTIQSRILFLSDNPKELAAARNSGLRVILACRPGNPAVTEPHSFDTLQSFDQLFN